MATPDKTTIDPHLYYAVPVHVMDQALQDRMLADRPARFWYDAGEGKAWVIVYRRNTARGYGWLVHPVLVPLWGIVVSQKPDPPPMPEWAEDKER